MNDYLREIVVGPRTTSDDVLRALRDFLRKHDPKERAKYEALPIWRKNDPGAVR